LTGAASVAETGVVNAPLKGMNGIYVYKVTDRSEGSYYTDDDAKSNKNMIDAYYMLKYNYYVNQMAMYQVEDPGLVKDYSYLYF
jgi:parvulin-like peptidyl-prolyl isomerase